METGENNDFVPVISKFDNQTNVVADMLGGVTATVADFGASVWNSLPFTETVATEDLLNRVSDNALRVYQENPDTIHAASFIGGIFVPAGLSLKLMNATRNGTKSINFFSEAGQAVQKTKVAEALEKSGIASAAYKQELRTLYAGNVGNVVLDNIAMELAIVGTLNAHPYMEDYMKDPVKNFMTSLALGTAIIGPISHIGLKGEMKLSAIQDYKNKFGILNSGTKDIPVTLASSEQIAIMQRNVENWEGMLQGQNMPAGPSLPASGFLKEILENRIQTQKVRQVEVLDNMAQGEFKTFINEEGNKNFRDNLIKEISDNPEKFAGVNTIAFATAKEELTFMQKAFGTLQKTTNDNKNDIPLTTVIKSGKNAGELATKDVVYSPRFGAFFGTEDLRGFGVAADLTTDAKSLTKGMTSNWYHSPNVDAMFEQMGMSSAWIDREYLRKLKAVDELSVEQLTGFVASPFDGPTLNAVIARLQKMQRNGEDISKIQVVLRENRPEWGKVEQELFKQVQRVGNTNGVGVKATYLQDIQAITSPANFSKYNLLDQASTPPPLHRMLYDWTRSWAAQKPTREMFLDAYTTPGHYVNEQGKLVNGTKYNTNQKMIDLIKQGYDLPGAKAFREELMKHAEIGADGVAYVYLFRGLKQKATTSNILESYTTHAGKAGEFVKGAEGSVKLYKVAVRDIYAPIRDTVVGAAGSSKSIEILVLAPGRKALEGAHELPIAERIATVPEKLLDLKTFNIDTQGMKAFDKANLKTITLNAHDEFVATKPFDTATMTKDAYELEMQSYIKAQLDEYITDVATFNSAKALHNQETNVGASLTDLIEAATKLKIQNIQASINQGTPLEVIHLRENVPLESLKAIAGGKNPSEVAGLFNYTQADQIEKYLGVENRSIRLGTEASKIPVAQIRASLHKQHMDATDATIKDMILASSKSGIARDLHAFLSSEQNGQLRNILAGEIASINPATLGSKFWQSTDFALRDMGTVGDVISAIGKDASHLYGKYATQVIQPISDAFTSITKDKAAIVEFNTAKELNASIKGYRELRVSSILDDEGKVISKEAKFFYQDYDDPWVIDAVTGEKTRNMREAKLPSGGSFSIKTQSVVRAYEEMQAAGRELYNLNTTVRTTLGQGAISDLGFWMPALNPRDKYLTYVLDTSTGATRLLWGRTPEELQSAKSAFLETLTQDEIKRGVIKLVDKGSDQRMFNMLEARHDPMFMESADVSAFHKGSSANAMVPTNTAAFSELTNAYEHYIHRSVGDVLELHYSDTMTKLDALSVLAKKGIEGQPVSAVQKAMNIPHDPGTVVKNTLLGKSNLKEYVGWQNAQNSITVGVESILQEVVKVTDMFVNPAKSLFGRGKSLSDKEWENLVTDMERRGIPNPFAALDEATAKERYHVEKISQAPNLTARSVALGNNLAATFMLRLMELGQPLVNMLSLPILTSAAVQKQLNPEYFGVKLVSNPRFSTTEAMYSGARYLFSQEFQGKYKKMGQDLGIFNPVVSEVSEMLQLNRSFNPGIMQKVENAFNTSKENLEQNMIAKTVEMLSRPADWSEKAVRELSFATGVMMAKRSYPGLGDAGVITFARNFVDTAIGNYNPAQRPTVFQGSLGVAMGLFQTYFVTLAQQIYRRFELRDYKSLLKMTLMQNNIFGMKSLPGFNQVSEIIGDHFSDQNYDLTTGTYRALPSPMADAILYGLPSNLGPAVYTRGDIQPRIPNIAGGLQNLAFVNILGSALKAGHGLASAATEIGGPGAGKAMLEALSVQSLSRPIARLAELGTGYAVTSHGNQVAGPEEIYSVPGISARLFATRSLTENKAREAMHLKTMYGSIDREARQEATQLLKNHIRSGTLTPDIQERIAEKYMRTGSPTGWRNAIRTAVHDTDSPGVSAVRNHLSPNSPGIMMIDDMD